MTSLPSTQVEVVRPRSANEVAAILRTANQEERAISTSKSVNSLLRLDLSALNAIEHYEPGDLTIRVQAGARVREVLAALAQHRQMLPLDVPGDEHATIGGVLATAAHGPMRASFGGVREYCIGMEFVTADGTLAHAGGMVVKNVAGYDLMKLLIGSRGTLGVITSASFKVFPMPQRMTTFVASFDGSEEAIRLAQTVRRSALNPLRLEIASPGTAGLDRWSVLISATGTENVLNRYRSELHSAVRDLLELNGQEEEAIWKAMNGQYSDAFIGSAAGLVVDVSTAMTGTVQACKLLEDAARQFAARVTIQGRIGIGNLIGIFQSNSRDELIGHLRHNLPFDMFLQIVHPRTPIDLSQNMAMQIVKRALDPKNLLNSGAAIL
jgi:FAD/FMN-containing dehydrogenase